MRFQKTYLFCFSLRVLTSCFPLSLSLLTSCFQKCVLSGKTDSKLSSTFDAALCQQVPKLTSGSERFMANICCSRCLVNQGMVRAPGCRPSDRGSSRKPGRCPGFSPVCCITRVINLAYWVFWFFMQNGLSFCLPTTQSLCRIHRRVPAKLLARKKMGIVRLLIQSAPRVTQCVCQSLTQVQRWGEGVWCHLLRDDVWEAMLCHPVGLSQVREGGGDSHRGE